MNGIWEGPKGAGGISPLNRDRQTLAQELFCTEVSQFLYQISSNSTYEIWIFKNSIKKHMKFNVLKGLLIDKVKLLNKWIFKQTTWANQKVTCWEFKKGEVLFKSSINNN